MTQTAPEVNTQLGELIAAKMEEKGLSIREMAKALDITYEHTRRVVRGEGIPSKYVLKLFAEKLNLNYDEIERIAKFDKITKKYGDVALEMAGKDPELEPMARVWPNLSTNQKASLLDMAKSMVRANRATKN